MTPQHAIVGAAVFDGTTMQEGAVVLITDAEPVITSVGDLPADVPRISLEGGVILPGFVDLQVNGGGGVMLNDAPDPATVAQMANAHWGLGTRGFLPTLITDTPARTTDAITAVAAAIAAGTPGVLGLHLEGPHLDPDRCGAHDPRLIRPMTDADLTQLLAAADTLPNLMVTLAPEAASPAQIAALAAAGVIVSLGHSNADYDTAMRAFDAGASAATHLFNAMSGLESRAPGLVGAALTCPAASAGLIADGIHVHPATIRAALAAKQGPGTVFLVSDAMACAGSDIDSFTLNGRRITRRGGRLTLADGTLAGADLTMARAVEVLVNDVGMPLDDTLRRTTSAPASLLRNGMGVGHWPDTPSGLIHVGADLRTVTALPDL